MCDWSSDVCSADMWCSRINRLKTACLASLDMVLARRAGSALFVALVLVVVVAFLATFFSTFFGACAAALRGARFDVDGRLAGAAFLTFALTCMGVLLIC